MKEKWIWIYKLKFKYKYRCRQCNILPWLMYTDGTAVNCNTGRRAMMQTAQRTVGGLRHVVFVIVCLFLPPWRWPHKLPKHVAGYCVINWHSYTKMYLLVFWHVYVLWLAVSPWKFSPTVKWSRCQGHSLTEIKTSLSIKIKRHNAITQWASGNAWADVSRSSIRFTYSSVARHIGPCVCHNSQTYRVSQEECARLWEGVPYVKVYRYNPKTPMSKVERLRR